MMYVVGAENEIELELHRQGAQPDLDSVEFVQFEKIPYTDDAGIDEIKACSRGRSSPATMPQPATSRFRPSRSPAPLVDADERRSWSCRRSTVAKLDVPNRMADEAMNVQSSR